MSSNKSNRPLPSTSFTIRSIFVITTVFAGGAVSLGYLYRAADGDTDEVGPFIIFTMLMPLALMVVMSWIFRIGHWYEKWREKRR